VYDRNDGDNEQLEVLQTLQEMLIKLIRIEVTMKVPNFYNLVIG